jgi:hypothetical protein
MTKLMDSNHPSRLLEGSAADESYRSGYNKKQLTSYDSIQLI